MGIGARHDAVIPGVLAGSPGRVGEKVFSLGMAAPWAGCLVAIKPMLEAVSRDTGPGRGADLVKVDSPLSAFSGIGMCFS